MPFSTSSLPESTSPDLHLTHPTASECQQIWTLLHPAWGDSLNLIQFLAESAYLLTVPLARNGGMTLWILVDRNLPRDERPILASCETFKKQGLLAREDVGVQDVVLHGIASVYCDPDYRGRGYAQRMMRELGNVLKTWQVGAGETCVGSVLYSDIGKDYYRKLGWAPVGRNTHFEFPAKKREESERFEDESIILDANLQELCEQDKVLVRQSLAKEGKNDLMVLPDEDHMRWHHAKENFVCERIFDKDCPSKGVLVGKRESENRAWAIWTRRFYGDRKTARRDNTLYILRLVFEKQNPDEEDLAKMQKLLKIIIQAAQAEADNWGLGTVKMWDPSPLVLKLLLGLGIENKLVERQQECIASLMWYGEGDVPEWPANEKYAWL